MCSDHQAKRANRIKAFTDDCRGAIYIWVAGGIMAVFGLAGLAIDMSHFYVVRNQLQISADSAALAGAMVMSDTTKMNAEAKKYAQMNVGDDVYVLHDRDIQRGTWDFGSKTFTVDGAKPNAVKVTTRKANVNNNAAGTFFARVLSIDDVDIATSAVAAYATDDEWDVLVVQDVTGSFSAEIAAARDANHALLDCLQQRTSGDSLVGMVTFTGVAQDYVTLETMEVGYDNHSSMIDGLAPCGSLGMPECSGTHVGAGMERAMGMFTDADAADPDRETHGLGRAMVILGDGTPNATGPNAHLTNQDLINHANAMADLAAADDISVYTVFYDEADNDTAAAFFHGLTRGDGTALRTPDAAALPGLFASLCAQLPLRLVQ